MMHACCTGAVTFQPTITKTYNTSNLLEDIKGLYKLAGLKGQKVGPLSLSDIPVMGQAAYSMSTCMGWNCGPDLSGGLSLLTVCAMLRLLCFRLACWLATKVGSCCALMSACSHQTQPAFST